MQDAPRHEKLLRSADGIEFISIKCRQPRDQAPREREEVNLYISSIAHARAFSLSELSSIGTRSFLLAIPALSAAASSSKIGCIWLLIWRYVSA